MKILFLSRWYPYPSDNGSKIRILNLLQFLATRHEVDLISFFSEQISQDHLIAMQQYCSQVRVARYRPFEPHGLKAMLGYFSPKPRFVIDTYNFEMESLVDDARQQKNYDVVIASQIDMTPYALRVSDTPKIFEELELTTLYEQYANQTQSLKKLRASLMWWKKSRYTANLLPNFAGCTVVSEGERKRVLEIVPDYQSVVIIPNGVDTAHYAGDFGPVKPDTLVYSGALSYYPNFDAMEFFISQILPLIQAERPNVKLIITGKRDETLINRLPANEQVFFSGYLDDIRPTVAGSWLSIAPLRLGGGTRLKILEAMAAGTPVVSTSKGAEGLEVTSGQDIFIADTPTDFATIVLRLLTDSDLRETISHNARQTARNKYDWQIIGQKFDGFIESTIND